MSFEINISDEFEAWFLTQDEDLQNKVTAFVNLLSEEGPSLGRPYADTLEGSKLANLKELRVQHKREPYRILFAFDPIREALLLVAGNKAGDKDWYKRMIPLAEAIFEKHLADLERDNHG